jgi:hypothetical protein
MVSVAPNFEKANWFEHVWPRAIILFLNAWPKINKNGRGRESRPSTNAFESDVPSLGDEEAAILVKLRTSHNTKTH